MFFLLSRSSALQNVSCWFLRLLTEFGIFVCLFPVFIHPNWFLCYWITLDLGSKKIHTYLQTHPAVYSMFANLTFWRYLCLQSPTDDAPKPKHVEETTGIKNKLVIFYRSTSFHHEDFFADENQEGSWIVTGGQIEDGSLERLLRWQK